MTELPYPDRHHASSAEGWLELGVIGEAVRELEEISKAHQAHPDVLEILWRVLAHQKRWDNAVDIAGELIRIAPDRVNGWVNRSYSLHELGRTREALDGLKAIIARFPKDSIIPYNLACYACQLGDEIGAQNWILMAARLRPKEEIRSMGLEDPDLKPLQRFLKDL